MHSDIGRFTAKVISFEKIQSLPTGSAPNIKHPGVSFIGPTYAATLTGYSPHQPQWAHRDQFLPTKEAISRDDWHQPA